VILIFNSLTNEILPKMADKIPIEEHDFKFEARNPNS
jgi:hypothetical protein